MISLARHSFKSAFNSKLAVSTSFAWSKTALDQWLLIRLTFVCCSVVFGAALFVVFYAETLNVALVGTVVSSALNLTSELRFAVRFTTDMESKLNGFVRLEEYARDLPREKAYEKESDRALVNRGWVKEGRVEMRGLKMRYREDLDLVLKGVDVVIEGGEKCGVVGRTGSGKSSLMMALFRIVEASEGRILVDGEDISTVGLDLLRRR